MRCRIRRRGALSPRAFSIAYLDRAAPRLAPPKFLAPAFALGPFIEPAPGSNCPGRTFGAGRSAPSSRFLAFCAAFAFALRRALALVMPSSPFQVCFADRRWSLSPKRRAVLLRVQQLDRCLGPEGYKVELNESLWQSARRTELCFERPKDGAMYERANCIPTVRDRTPPA